MGKKQDTKQSTKILKVSYGYYISSRKKYPLINLAGLYLATFDFKVGDRVKVEITKGKPLITKIESEKETTYGLFAET